MRFAPQTTEKPKPSVRRIVLLSVITFALVGGASAGSVAVYNSFYHSRVYPGVHVGAYSFGGFSANEAKQFVEGANNRYSHNGLPIVFTDKLGASRTVQFSIAPDDETPESMKLQSEIAAEQAMAVGRNGSGWGNFWYPLWLRFNPVQIAVPVIVDTERVESSLRATLASYEDVAHDAALVYDPTSKTPTVVREEVGQTFNYEDIIQQLQTTMSKMSEAPASASLMLRTPTIVASEITAVLPKLQSVIALGGMSLHYVHPETKERIEWEISDANIAGFVAVERDNERNIIVSLDSQKLTRYIDETITPEIYTEPKEAKFTMNDGKVEEFQASRTGLTVSKEETVEQLMAAFRARNYETDSIIKTVAVTVKIVEPTLRTAEVNSLGITEMLGTGTSNFKNSPSNRIKNIALAVKKINGLLIKPGEEFSANKAAGPYTTENGYLPEQVIKGNKIIPEVGGGMCQVGTTLFRMAMNSGMPITERTNHSLVVSYYSDPFNGNPGTDATLYEPVLDFKFLNDTGSHILLETEMDVEKGELRFTLWGKPDGRNGSFTHPLVSRWIPAGATQVTYVDNGSLKPGERKCQNAFRGAVASFTYTRVTPEGETVNHVFDSYYRPLPQICLEGAEPGTVCDGKLCVTTAPETEGPFGLPPGTPEATE